MKITINYHHMKHFSTILVAVLLLISTSSFGQNLKFGHVDFEYLIALMPDRDSAYAKLSIYGQSLEQTLQELQTELQTKYNTFQRQQATWTAAVLETKQKELNDINNNLMSFQETASQEYDQMRTVLLTPVYQKARATIEKIGKEKGLVYIHNSPQLLYIDTNISEDLLPAARRELGIPADKVPAQLPQ
jgi:Outer membrane protein